MMRRHCLVRFGIALLVFAITLICCSSVWAAEIERTTRELKLGGSDLIKTSHPFKRVSIADPTVADVVVLSPHELYVYGKKVGYTSVILWDEGKGKTLLDVVVSLDLTALKQKLYELYPEQKIEVYGSETGVVLAGTVSGPEIVEQVLRLTQTYMPKKAEGEGGKQGTGRSGHAVTNLLQVEGIQQVMLEVKFAEVNRDSTRDWQAALAVGDIGENIFGAVGVNGLGALAATEAGSLLVNFAGIENNIFAKIDDVTTALEFLETEGLARLLAEPRLVTMSGQEASFLAGGEFPIPVPQSGANGTTITIEFREFGVGLVFTPVVLSDGKISLRVAPSVTRTTTDSAVQIGDGTGEVFFVPSLSTRKLETTVQLYDGQTLALAGLLEDNLRETVSKVPGLGDVPILGALFRSSEYRQEKTDLLITVTPSLVKPVKQSDLRYPGENFQEPNSFQFYLEGRLDGTTETDATMEDRFVGETAASQSQHGLEGTFGHQSVTVQQ